MITQSEFPRLVPTAISACAARIGIFDCSLCALNHSALQHVNEAIHRRVTRAAPSYVSDGNPRGWYQLVRSVSRERSMPLLRGFSFLLSAVSSSRFILFSSISSLSLSSSLSFSLACETDNFSRENSRHASPFLRRIFSPGVPLSLHVCRTNFPGTSVKHGCAVTADKRG